jgi:hypothetical protein
VDDDFQLVTKGELAKRMNLTPSAISKMIERNGLPKGIELVGEGRRAMVKVPAGVDVSAGMTPGQRLTQLTKGRARAQQASAAEEPAAAPLQPELPIAERIQPQDDSARYLRAKAERAEIEARAARIRELADAGAYMVTTRAQAAWAKELLTLLTAIELWLPELAEDLAAAGGVEQRAALSVLRGRWRHFRQQRADLAASSLASMPRHVDHGGRVVSPGELGALN